MEELNKQQRRLGPKGDCKGRGTKHNNIIGLLVYES